MYIYAKQQPANKSYQMQPPKYWVLFPSQSYSSFDIPFPWGHVAEKPSTVCEGGHPSANAMLPLVPVDHHPCVLLSFLNVWFDQKRQSPVLEVILSVSFKIFSLYSSLPPSHPLSVLSSVGKTFPDSSVGREPACNAGDPGSIPGSGRFPGEGNGKPLQYSCLENPMDRGSWCRLLSMGLQRISMNTFLIICFQCGCWILNSC